MGVNNLDKIWGGIQDTLRFLIGKGVSNFTFWDKKRLVYLLEERDLKIPSFFNTIFIISSLGHFIRHLQLGTQEYAKIGHW